MNNLIGTKCKGFKFEDEDGYYYDMDKHIGEVGEITYIDDLFAGIKFEKNFWSYPLDQIEKHLVPEEIEIPKLVEGVLMEVSDNENFKDAETLLVFGQLKGNILAYEEDGSRLYFSEWQYARPIKQKVTLTKQEIADKFEIDINQLIIK